MLRIMFITMCTNIMYYRLFFFFKPVEISDIRSLFCLISNYFNIIT